MKGSRFLQTTPDISLYKNIPLYNDINIYESMSSSRIVYSIDLIEKINSEICFTIRNKEKTNDEIEDYNIISESVLDINNNLNNYSFGVDISKMLWSKKKGYLTYIGKSIINIFNNTPNMFDASNSSNVVDTSNYIHIDQYKNKFEYVSISVPEYTMNCNYNNVEKVFKYKTNLTIVFVNNKLCCIIEQSYNSSGYSYFENNYDFYMFNIALYNAL